MHTIAYCHPFVPPEWIAAHGLRPCWLRPDRRKIGDIQRGVCPAAASLVEALGEGSSIEAVVLTTTCDQIRYAASLLEQRGKPPLFLMHVPRTWQTPASRSFYRDELKRLGRFLMEQGGKSPTAEFLREVMLRYDRARLELRRRREELSAIEFAEALNRIRGNLPAGKTSGFLRLLMPWWLLHVSKTFFPGNRLFGDQPPVGRKKPRSLAMRGSITAAVPVVAKQNVALVGGPMLDKDNELLQIIEDAGGRVVLDATESGERTLPAPFDTHRLDADPLEELTRAYFDAIPDVFRRPNDPLYMWLRQELADRGVRGIIVHRYVGCDLWHAELPRLKQECSLPLLDWDIAGDEHSAKARAVGRLESFFEMLQ
jgi:benzoyl-CoA reductase/2-hydroxyglutaryl-CoA dehydratase subunit BcrC/BadD/HgdB